jgi:hypothetical protein
MQKSLDRLSVDLQKQGITLVVVIVPNKSTIYSQYMPNEIPVIGREGDIDDFLQYLRMSGKTTIIDLRETLSEQSRNQQLYYKTDTHWNDLGTYYAYLQIMKILSGRYPTLHPHPLSDFNRLDLGNSTRDLVRIIGVSGHAEENWMFVPKFEVHLKASSEDVPTGVMPIRAVINSDRSLPSLLVFHDSFYVTLARFMEPHFSRIRTIPYRVNDDTWTLKWIQQEQPNIVMIEFVERYLQYSVPSLLKTITP